MTALREVTTWEMENINEDMDDTSMGRTSRDQTVQAKDITQEDMEELNEEADSIIERVLSRQISRRRLSLIEAPEFIVRLGSFKEVLSGETVVFSAQYRAFPRPAVKWFKNEEEIHETHRHSFELDDEDGITRFVLRDVGVSDEGTYKCVVENQEGAASTTGYLTVIGRLQKERTQLPSTPAASQPTAANPSPSRKSERSSTPSGLRPIVEQKSVEEREAEECGQQGPSPLQEFIDVVQRRKRRFSQRAGPLVFCPDELYYATAEQDSSDKTFESDEESSGNVNPDSVLSPMLTPVTNSKPAELREASTSPYSPSAKSSPPISESPSQPDAVARSSHCSRWTAFNKDVVIRDATSNASETVDEQCDNSCRLNSFKHSLPPSHPSTGHGRDQHPVKTEYVLGTYDSDYDSDDTPTSISEVNISHLLLNPQTNPASSSAQLGLHEKNLTLKLTKRKEEVSKELEKTNIEERTEVTKSETSISNLDVPIKKVSLQQRRSRLHSHAMRHRAVEEPTNDNIQMSSSSSLSPSSHIPLRISIKTSRRITKKEEDTSGIVLLPESVCHFYESSLGKSNNAITSSVNKESQHYSSQDTSSFKEAQTTSDVQRNQDPKTNVSEDSVEDNLRQVQETKSYISKLEVLVNVETNKAMFEQALDRNILCHTTLLSFKPYLDFNELNGVQFEPVKVTSRVDLSHSKVLRTFQRPKPQTISIVTGKTGPLDEKSCKIVEMQDCTEQSKECVKLKTSSSSPTTATTTTANRNSFYEHKTMLECSDAESAESSKSIKPVQTSSTRWPSLQSVSQLKDSSIQSEEPAIVNIRRSSLTRSFIIDQVAIKPLVPSFDSSAVDPLRQPGLFIKCKSYDCEQTSNVRQKLDTPQIIPEITIDKQNIKSPLNFDELSQPSSQCSSSLNEEINRSVEVEKGLYYAFECMLKSLEAPSVQFYLLFTTLSTALAAAAGTVSAFSPPLLVVSGALVVVVTESLRLLIERGRRQWLNSIS